MKGFKLSTIECANRSPLKREPRVDAQKVHSFSWAICVLSTTKGMDFNMIDAKSFMEFFEREFNFKFVDADTGRDALDVINERRDKTSNKVSDTDAQTGYILLHICENCEKQELLYGEEAHKQGWDYPPKTGQFKIVSPRTCGACGIETTLWWELTCNKTPISQLSKKHMQTLQRILGEPDSILPDSVDS